MTDNWNTRLKRRLSASTIWSVTLIWFTLPFYLLFTFAFDSLRLADLQPVWLWIGLATYAELVLLTTLVTKFLPKQLWKSKFAYLTNLSLAFFLGGVKNLSVALLAMGLGVEQNISLVPRFVGGGILGTALLFLFVVTFGSRVEHRTVMSSLARVRTQLENHRLNAPAMVAERQLALVQETQNSLLPELEKIRNQIGKKSAVSETIDSLRNVIQNQVRPLSHGFHDKATVIARNHLQDLATSNMKVQFPREFSIGNTLIVSFPTLGFAIAVLGTGPVLYGQDAIAIGIVSIIPFAGAVYLSKMFASKMPVASLFKNMSVACGIGVFAAFLSVPVFYFGVHRNPSDPLMVGTLVFTCVFVIAASVYSMALENSRIALEKETKKVNNELRRELSIFEQQVKLTSMRWSYLLHGTVQPALVAALTRLGSNHQISAETTKQVLKDLKGVEKAIQQSPNEIVDINKDVQKLERNWQGLCNVHYACSTAADKTLKTNSASALCVSEVIKEGVSNAYRHSSAKDVWVSVHQMSDDSIEVLMRNDGEYHPTKEAKTGLGTKMFDELALEWGIREEPEVGQTVLRVVIPISRP